LHGLKLSRSLAFTIILRGGWIRTSVARGDFVNFIGEILDIKRREIVVDDTKNLLILHPDVLISGSFLSKAIGCVRKAVLSLRAKARAEFRCFSF